MLLAALIGVDHLTGGDLLRGSIEHIVEGRNRLPGRLEHGAVVDEGGVCRQLVAHLDHGDVPTLLGQEHAGLHADFAAAGGFTFKGQSDDDDLTVELDEEDGQGEEESYSGEDYE